MRILHIIESDGGTVEFIFLLAKCSADTEHIVFAGKRAWIALKKIEELNPTNFPLNLMLIYWEGAEREISLTKDINALLFLLKWLKSQKNYDVIHLHSSKAGFLGRVATKIARKKNVVYTTQAVSFIRTDISKIKRKLFILLEQIGSRLGGTVVCCSDSERLAMLEKGIKAITIPNGTQFTPLPTVSPAGDTVKVMSIGRATIQKNPAMFRKIADGFISNRQVEFIWVGDGELKEELVADNIKITGWLSREKVRETLLEADIYVSTASWEGMPFAVLEAMAFAKPLVLSYCIGNVDLVKNQANGFIFKTTEEAIRYLNVLIDNKAKRLEMGQASRYLFENKYDFELVTKEFLRLYLQVSKL